MCGSKPKADNSAAEEARRKEEERRRKIAEGKTRIDSAFSQFNDGYYDQYNADYRGYYTPELEDQYSTARDKLTAVLAGRGILEGTPGASRIAELDKKYNTTRTQVANDAEAASRDLRTRVENNKTDLYSLNQSSADPEGIGARAIGQATALEAPPTYNPLGDVFASLLGSIGGSVGGQSGVNTRLYGSPQPTLYVSPTGSGRVVN